MVCNNHDDVMRAIEALDKRYSHKPDEHLTYTVECMKEMELALEYTIRLKEYPHWLSADLYYNLACYFGECLVRIFGGKWMFETGRYADNSRLSVQLRGVMYYPEDFIERSYREDFVIYLS